MSSDLFRLKVLAIKGRVIELDVSIVDGESLCVPRDEVFIAEMLAEEMCEDTIRQLFPAADPEEPEVFADEWMRGHADQVVEPGSVVLFDERDHPRVPRYHYQLTASFLARHGDAWQREPRSVVAAIAKELAADGLGLEYADEPELYLTGPLEDLVEEAVSLLLAAEPTPRASLRFRVRDAKWVAHLKVGDEFGTTSFER